MELNEALRALVHRTMDELIDAEAATGVVLKPITNGYHVKDLPDGRCVDVLHMLFNWRIVRTDARDDSGEHISYDRAWCYQGTGRDTFLRAVGEALAWDGADDTEPEGYLKRAC